MVKDSPAKPRRTAHFADVESGAGRDCADSCSSLDEHGRLLGSESSASDTLDWESDASEPSDEEKEHGKPSRWRPNWSRGGSVALICLLLTLGSFVIPESEDGASVIWHDVLGYGNAAKDHAVHQTSAFIAHVQGKRHCRPKPNPLLPQSERPRPCCSVRSWLQGQPSICGKPSLGSACVNAEIDTVHVAGIGESYEMEQPKERGQWLVEARHDGLLSIMTPVYPDKETLQLLLNQLRSANKFLNMDSIKEWIFIAPEEKVPTLVRFLEDEIGPQLPCVLAKKMRVVADEVCVPELRNSELQRIATNQAHAISGWVKQQLIKLACSFTVQTPYFLITDADTFFMRPLEALDLMQQRDCKADSGVCDLRKKVQFRARNEMQQPPSGGEQKEWISGSAAALNISDPVGNLRTMGVTPQIMSRAVLDPMAAYLEREVTQEGDSWRAHLLRAQAAQLNHSETQHVPAWTEYDLYWEYARYAELWKKYHTHTVLQRSQANLWKREDYDDWDPCDQVDMEKHDGFWAVVQSSLHISASLIWKKLAPCMAHGMTGG